MPPPAPPFFSRPLGEPRFLGSFLARGDYGPGSTLGAVVPPQGDCSSSEVEGGQGPAHHRESSVRAVIGADLMGGDPGYQGLPGGGVWGAAPALSPTAVTVPPAWPGLSGRPAQDCPPISQPLPSCSRQFYIPWGLCKAEDFLLPRPTAALTRVRGRGVGRGRAACWSPSPASRVWGGRPGTDTGP